MWSVRKRSAAAACVGFYAETQLSAWLEAPLPAIVAALIAARSVFVADVDGQMVGYAALDGPGRVVEAVFVDPSFAGQGIGRALLETLELTAIRGGIVQLRLSSTPNAERFYIAAA